MKIDGDVLFGLLKKVCPATYKHLVGIAVKLFFFGFKIWRLHGVGVKRVFLFIRL